uniref:Putative secreted protein n=1 Tax=Anopheles marajoara TaxID=58244 RepID=A0A2M4CDJ8_9DIPT
MRTMTSLSLSVSLYLPFYLSFSLAHCVLRTGDSLLVNENYVNRRAAIGCDRKSRPRGQSPPLPTPRSRRLQD